MERMFHGASRYPSEPPYGDVERRENQIRYLRDIADADSSESIPAIGDVLRISKNRQVIIANFRKQGLLEQMTFPGLIKGQIDAEDETGVQFETGSLVIVRDVQLGAYPNNENAAVWARVASCQFGTPQCEEALQIARRSEEPLQ